MRIYAIIQYEAELSKSKYAEDMATNRSVMRRTVSRALSLIIALAMPVIMTAGCGSAVQPNSTSPAAPSDTTSSHSMPPNNNTGEETMAKIAPWNVTTGRNDGVVPQVTDDYADTRDESEATPSTSLSHEHDLSINSYAVVSDATLRLYFIGGTDSCYGYRVDIQETDTQVAVRLVEGLIPGAPEACTMQAVYYTMIVTLQQPLGNRTVIDQSVRN